jgi:hypothetical protein
MKTPSSKLINVLIAKGIIETLFVGAIAVGFHLTSFPPTFHGWGEAVYSSRSISGWAVNDASQWERVEVQLFVDGTFAGTQVARLSRPDVKAAGWAVDEWHGYSFQLGEVSYGPHEVRVYAVHPSGNGARYTLQLLGDPIVFSATASGTWQSVSINTNK